MFFRIYKSYLLLLSCTFLAACSYSSESQNHRYYSWQGLEPDRWSSIWLLKRHVDHKAEISIVPVGAQVSNAVAVATPKSTIQRTHGKSNYENMVGFYNKTGDVALLRLGQIINEIEISPWQSSTPAVAVVEQQFRQLQLKYNRVDVPYACYSGFFDTLYDILKKGDVEETESYLVALGEQLSPDVICESNKHPIATASDLPVQEYPVEFVLKMINANKRVVFVDTREDEEFDEHHIPGAVNLKLREVDADTAEQFAQADLVISYCIKDFRGYEVAQALSHAGVENVGIMNPYGLKGWKDLMLPVVDEATSDHVALEALKKRAAEGV